MLNSKKSATEHSATTAPKIDFETIRETLSRMYEDASRVKGVEHVAAALHEAIKQVELAQVCATGPELKIIRSASFPSRVY